MLSEFRAWANAKLADPLRHLDGTTFKGSKEKDINKKQASESIAKHGGVAFDAVLVNSNVNTRRCIVVDSSGLKFYRRPTGDDPPSVLSGDATIPFKRIAQLESFVTALDENKARSVWIHVTNADESVSIVTDSHKNVTELSPDAFVQRVLLENIQARSVFCRLVTVLDTRVSFKTTNLKPPWVPDDLASKCMRCSDEFTLVNRKHHCRGCGAIVCGDCSKGKATLPKHGYTEPVRVCDYCFRTIKNARLSSFMQNPNSGFRAVNSTQKQLDTAVADSEDGGEVVPSASDPNTAVDQYGFQVNRTPTPVQAEGKASNSRFSLMSSLGRQKKKYQYTLEWLRAEWNQFLVLHPVIEKTGEFRDLVRLGIPPELRGQLWQVMCGSKRRKWTLQGKHANANTYYCSLVAEAEATASEAVTSEIEKDLRRTFPDNSLYQHDDTLSSLRRVLFACSVHNKQIGYCQSMNFLCALLLLFMEEEAAFYCLITLVEVMFCIDNNSDPYEQVDVDKPSSGNNFFTRDKSSVAVEKTASRDNDENFSMQQGDDFGPATVNEHSFMLSMDDRYMRASIDQSSLSVMTGKNSTQVSNDDTNSMLDSKDFAHRSYYHQHDLLGVHVDQAVFAVLLEEWLPRIHNKLTQCGLTTEPLTINWFLSLYVNTLPVETTLHVWDCLFNEGAKVLFLVGLTLLKLNETALLACKTADDVLGVFKDLPESANDSVEFMRLCFDESWLPSLSMKRIGMLRRIEKIKLREQRRERLERRAALVQQREQRTTTSKK